MRVSTIINSSNKQPLFPPNNHLPSQCRISSYLALLDPCMQNDGDKRKQHTSLHPEREREREKKKRPCASSLGPKTPRTLLVLVIREAEVKKEFVSYNTTNASAPNTSDQGKKHNRQLTNSKKSKKGRDKEQKKKNLQETDDGRSSPFCQLLATRGSWERCVYVCIHVYAWYWIKNLSGLACVYVCVFNIGSTIWICRCVVYEYHCGRCQRSREDMIVTK